MVQSSNLQVIVGIYEFCWVWSANEFECAMLVAAPIVRFGPQRLGAENGLYELTCFTELDSSTR